MSIRVRWACGHMGSVVPTTDATPRCPSCGEHRVQAVQARAPRFTGACSGPYAETTAVEPLPVSLAERPLRLKKDSTDG